MPRVTYSEAQKREAVALARIVGADLASSQLGIGGKDTIRKWMAQAGAPSELQGSPAVWGRIQELALAKAEQLVATGRLSPIQLLTVAGIARRNESKSEPAAASSVMARDTFADWVTGEAAPMLRDDADLDDLASGIRHLRHELLIRANAEDAAGMTEHRSAILAWFSGRPEVEAGDVLEWAQAQVADIIATNGSLLGWERWRQATEAREAAISARAAVLVQSGMRPHEATAMARDISDDLPIPPVREVPA